MSILKVPTMIWTYNKDSLLHRENKDRTTNVVKDFIKAMTLSSEFVKQYKPNVEHMEATIKKMLQTINLNESDKEALNCLLERR